MMSNPTGDAIAAATPSLEARLRALHDDWQQRGDYLRPKSGGIYSEKALAWGTCYDLCARELAELLKEGK